MESSIRLLLILSFGASAAESLVYKALYVPSVLLLNKNCSEIEQLVISDALPVSRDAHTCGKSEGNQHSLFVNNIPPRFVIQEDFNPSQFKVIIEDSQGRFHRGLIDFTKESGMERLKDLRLTLKAENSKSLIEAEVRAQIVMSATDELTLGAKLLHSSLMGLTVAASMSLVFAVCTALRERFRQKKYLDDVRTPRDYDFGRLDCRASEERLICEENEPQDVIFTSETISKRSEQLIDL